MLDRMLLAAGGDEKLYVEDVFSTYLYTGNGSSQTITNGIDLAGKGGMVWLKCRPTGLGHYLYDTSRGVYNSVSSNTTNGQWTYTSSLTAFNSDGFSLGSFPETNEASRTYTSWTFRKAPKFFDVVTWSGDGSSSRAISHSLGSVPGCIIVKATNVSGQWETYHRGLNGGTNPQDCKILLNSNAAQAGPTTGAWAQTAPTSTVFYVNGNANTNDTGKNYVAYLFAHDPTADGIVQCGSYTGNGSATGPVINLGWEPQWVMVKAAGIAQDWFVFDNMRGMPVGSGDASISPNSSSAELSGLNAIDPTATGFNITSSGSSFNSSGVQYIYIAIRRGPMKTPTVGTSVFAPQATTGNNATSSGQFFTAGFPVDMSILTRRNGTSYMANGSRLAGPVRLYTNSTSAQDTVTGGFPNYASNTGFTEYGDPTTNTLVSWMFRRAPGFFDVVCYTGTGASATFNHNLGVVPELMIFKGRTTTTGSWATYAAPLGSAAGVYLNRNDPSAAVGSAFWASTPATTTSFSVTSSTVVNGSGNTYIAYLFASCPGVSKIGSYTGNGSSQTINCGFSNGARFFLVKRTDSTGDWWVYDSARGIVAAADPALALNSTAAEVTSADAVDTDSTGIIVNQEATCNINVNGATYIYLSVA